jgi:hypothetical protein
MKPNASMRKPLVGLRFAQPNLRRIHEPFLSRPAFTHSNALRRIALNRAHTIDALLAAAAITGSALVFGAYLATTPPLPVAPNLGAAAEAVPPDFIIVAR